MAEDVCGSRVYDSDAGYMFTGGDCEVEPYLVPSVVVCGPWWTVGSYSV